MRDEVFFTRAVSVAEAIERQLQATTRSIEAALYRLNSQRLAQVLENTLLRGARLRLLLDYNKYMSTPATRAVLTAHRLPFHLSRGRKGRWSKMHHKFVILDGETVLTGSYNWTIESEEHNYEAMLIIRDPPIVRSFLQEFEDLWAASTAVEEHSAGGR
jgi:phosphatidylserine/phosphatidylglycerophosphate/cardiolipin synthase-like enzyme